MEVQIRQHVKDSLPDQFSLDLQEGEVEVPVATAELMSAIALFCAKYDPALSGESLNSLRRRYNADATFRFLSSEDSLHRTFVSMVRAYRLILDVDFPDVENRLENLLQPKSILQEAHKKAEFLKAEIARRKAALLTDDVLRARLEWDHFHVVKSFTAADLGLLHVGARPQYQPTFLSAALLHPSSGGAEVSQPVGVTRVKHGIEFFVDPMTKEKIHVSDVNRKPVGAGTYSSVQSGDAKRERDETFLADDEEQGKNLIRRYKE
jgi:hypothetical protein